MKINLIAFSVALVTAGSAVAQQTVPAIDNTSQLAANVKGAPQAAYLMPPPPVNLLSNVQVDLDKKEQRAVFLANEWKAKNDMPTRGDEGAVVFVYGATLPTVVCAPLKPCNLLLQPGEVVQKIDSGDTVRWKTSPSLVGQGDQTTTVIVIKPTDSGLETAMTIATDRRLYTVKLVSRLTDWMPKVAFSYPEDVNKAWADYYANQARIKEATVLSNGLNIDGLDFGYKIDGDKPNWRPVRVYTDGRKTYIEFPASMKWDESPALVELGNDGGWFSDPSKKQVNYAPRGGNRFEVDKVLTRAALISGVGKSEEKVEITREVAR